MLINSKVSEFKPLELSDDTYVRSLFLIFRLQAPFSLEVDAALNLVW
jgi:hypothetical protein